MNLKAAPCTPLQLWPGFAEQSQSNWPPRRRRRNSADGYLAEAAGRCLSPVEALSPRRAPPSDGRPMSPDALSRGMSNQVMGLEGLMYGSPTYVRQTSRCAWKYSHNCTWLMGTEACMMLLHAGALAPSHCKMRCLSAIQ